MNKTELLSKVSEISGVNFSDCEKVMKAFETVCEQELSESKSMGNALDKIIRFLNFINRKS